MWGGPTCLGCACTRRKFDSGCSASPALTIPLCRLCVSPENRQSKGKALGENEVLKSRIAAGGRGVELEAQKAAATPTAPAASLLL